jgi:hypothetical protein
MNIEVKVEDITLASEIGGDVRRWNAEDDEWYGEPRTLADVIADRVVERITTEANWSHQVNEVRDARRSAVNAAIAEQVEKALSEPFTLTNQYGEPTGTKPVTLRDLIAAEISKFFTVTKGDSYGPKKTSAQTVIETAVNTYVSKELNAVMKVELDAAKKAIHDAAGALIARNIDKLTV